MRCTVCGYRIYDDNVYWVDASPYCEVCFNEEFVYCRNCDLIVAITNSYLGDEGLYCESCYEEISENDFPRNPVVDDSDRELILKIARQNLFKKERLCYIQINPDDAFLKDIRLKVGEIKTPIYLYGLKDRDECQIEASKDLLPGIARAILRYDLGLVKINETTSRRRLGLSYELRLKSQDKIVKLIKEITSCAE